MPHFNTILNILKRNDPISNLLIRSRCLPGREKVLEDLAYAFSEWGVEAFKNQVRVGFGDCTTGGGGEIMAEQYIVQGERGGRAMGKVGDGESSGGTAVFV